MDRNPRIPKDEAAMLCKSGAKCTPKDLCKTIYEMSFVGVRNKDIAEHYKMSRSTISYVISRLKKANSSGIKKKMGRKRKLSERGIRLLQKYVLGNCFDPLYVITARFNAATKLSLSINIVRCYIKRMNVNSCIAVQKHLVYQEH